jgi:hypothetical protein
MATKRRSEHPTVITIRALYRKRLIEQPISQDAPLLRLAEEWTYILRSRARWADDGDLRLWVRDRALDGLERVGVRRAFMKKLATAAHVEVELHGWKRGDARLDTLYEAASEVPWEYLISAATRGVGRFHNLLVTRLFRNGTRAIGSGPPGQVLFIESAPGRFEEVYEFRQERDRIKAAVGAEVRGHNDTARATMGISATENFADIKKRIRATPWDVLHVSGLDTHQATWYLPSFYEELEKERPSVWKRIVDPYERIRDGMILRESNIAELPVPYDDLASALIDRQHPPSLVTLNLYYSGARIAREMVARGARAALGFLDEIDDDLAERFFQAFFWAYSRPEGISIAKAFLAAWHKMKSDRMHGTAIVIWIGASAFELLERAERTLPAAPAPEETRKAVLERLADTPMRDLLQVQLEVPDEVNYSLLHNDRSLLRRLTLTKLVKEQLEDIEVVVELNLGAQNYPYRCTQMVLDEPQIEIGPRIRIPLTATLPRSLRERVISTLYVKVTCGKRTALEETKRVTLIPVDEWVDDTENNPWLPSFVLPRDPAVLGIVNASRRYLIGITDDPAAGFDGYQSVDEKAANPTAGVDAQVQAIWTALVHEYRLQYINPPPAYSERSQRLRTPTDILESKTGTCIDLALLLASCFEYIDIYPVVVLLSGHAFVGYWRSEDAHDSFVEVLHVPVEVPPVGSPLARQGGDRLVEQYGWRLTRLHYDEIMEYVTSGDLVMLEATYLTGAYSFAEAIEEGRANLRSRREFDSLLDIRLARSASPPVTPLPILHE